MRRAAARRMPCHRVFASAAFWLRLASSHTWRVRRTCTRQGNCASQAGMIVLELEFSAMQPGNRRSEAEAQARAGFRSALLEADKPLHHPPAIRIGNPWPTIRNAQHDAVAVV